jgi:hypothetical protein
MKIACLMCAVCMCSPQAFQATAAAPAPLESAPAERGPAQRGSVESSGASAPARAQSHGSARVSPAQGAVAKAANAAAIVPPHPAAARGGAGRFAHSNADRLHALPAAQAKPATKAPNRPAAGSSRAETSATALSRTPGLQGASTASVSRLAVPKIRAPALRSSDTPTRGALAGGPHLAGQGALGGPAMGRAAFGRAATANRAVLDGAQMRRRY